jgi:hypothetical protein
MLQTTLCLLLVAVGGMLVHSIYNLRNQDVGFHLEHREIVRVEPPIAKYTLIDLDRIYQILKTRLEELPGNHSASVAVNTPMDGSWTKYVTLPGETHSAMDDAHAVVEKHELNHCRSEGTPKSLP